MYEWIPKKGISLEAIERMRRHFHKPNYLMGEAWFNTKKRRLYPELNKKETFAAIKTTDLSLIIFEISSGTKCFGHYKEWDEWFKYLLPDLIIRSEEFQYFNQMLLQDVITAFMSIYWKGIPEEYKGFRNDVINSLSLCLMNENLWFDYKKEDNQTINLRPTFLDSYLNGQDKLKLFWDCGSSDENLSAMMFFCLKYLNTDEIITWVKSLFSIQDIYWKGAFSVWLLGAYDLLHEPIIIPSMIEKTVPNISWDYSSGLGSRYGSIDAEHPPHEDFNDNKDFIPYENSQIFLKEIRQQISPELLIDWAEQFAQDSLVAEGSYNVPELLLDKISR